MDITIVKNPNQMMIITCEKVNDWSDGAVGILQTKIQQIHPIFSNWKTVDSINVEYVPVEEHEECEYYSMPYLKFEKQKGVAISQQGQAIKTITLSFGKDDIHQGETLRNRAVHEWFVYASIKFNVNNNRVLNLALKKMNLPPLNKEQFLCLEENGNITIGI